MDISDTIAPKSDQLDAVDLLSGPQTFTVEEAKVTGGDQPVTIKLVEFPRPWRPGKSMRRVLVACWGKRSADYAGRQVRLFCDPDVMFGGKKVGGTRIEALSHIDKPIEVPLIETKGRSAIYVVQPLASIARANIPATLPTDWSVDQLRDAWKTADPPTRAAIEARVKELEPEGAGA